MMLYVKDYHNVSHAAYHELTQVCAQMPRQYKIKDRIAELNKLWNIKPPLPNEIEGVQQPLESKLRIRIEHLVKSSPPDTEFLQTKRIRVKLSGDGFMWSASRLLFLKKSDKTGSFEGNHILAIFKTPESYGYLKKALEDIIEQLSQIQVGDTIFSIQYFLGGNWKFLACVTGVDAASCTYACIWCKCSRDETYNNGRF